LARGDDLSLDKVVAEIAASLNSDPSPAKATPSESNG